MRLIWLPSVLRSVGVEVVTIDGWESRGRDLPSVQAVIWHHTATGPNWDDRRVAHLLRDGRRDLAGPLAQLGLDRRGRYWLVAAGRANHNGFGRHGNLSVGIEAFNDGRGEPWPEAQMRAWDRGTAAILRHLGMRTVRVLGHKESDPARKIDPAGVDMAAARGRIGRLQDGGGYVESDETYIASLYFGYFGEADAKGFAHWVKVLRDDNGWGREQVRAEFARIAKV